MRFVLIVLILSLVLGGFSSAAHAFGDAGSIGKTRIEKSSSGNCLHTAAGKSSKDNGQQAEFCVDCAHCCSAHTLLEQASCSYSMNVDLRACVLPLADSLRASGYIDSLLRPPRSLA